MAHTTLACQFCGKLNKVDLTRHAQGPKCAECGKPFLLDRPVKVTEENFDATVLKSEVPVLVDFYADWCGPCKMMAPALDEIAHEHAGSVLVAKVDTDHAPGVSMRYNIRGIPFFGLFENGQMVRNAVGAVGKRALVEMIEGRAARTA
jgi:thioredoxin